MREAVVRRRRRTGNVNVFLWLGASLLAVFVLLALFGQAIAPYDPNAQDLFAMLEPPSAGHLLGTDNVGRDILSRIIVGTRFTLSIALASVFFAGIGGIALGAVAGYFGGLTDRIVTGVIDLLLTVPNIVLAIAIASVAGSSAVGLTIAITASFIPPLARLVRGRVIELVQEDFIAASITVGMGHTRILLRHILPNAATVIIIELSLNAGQAVLIGSALGFLGLGVQPPAPEWGTMLGASREYLTVAPHIVFAPGLAISLLVLAFNAFGDGLRDVFDPASRS
ncbi:ABC transporter permease [Mesorhizobium australicum]|uniref:Peptide/nickel transport system permease protein n=1 Tax=Mesorhizobium australicum TaxID=536018 RepID=A0A1X7MTJ5_9HYPH|nr:ABC transporter permease [Mesorhizobium australicum]SMH28132.1 peptide/nickel transport system permease protein [Mesorhizobium australicum]